jgi:hypothetical protein
MLRLRTQWRRFQSSLGPAIIPLTLIIGFQKGNLRSRFPSLSSRRPRDSQNRRSGDRRIAKAIRAPNWAIYESLVGHMVGLRRDSRPWSPQISEYGTVHSIRVRGPRKWPGSFQSDGAFARRSLWCIQALATVRSVDAAVRPSGAP